jgi:hypothetical protein
MNPEICPACEGLACPVIDTRPALEELRRAEASLRELRGIVRYGS